MKKMILAIIILCVVCIDIQSKPQPYFEQGYPLGFYSGYIVDVNADNKDDIVFLTQVYDTYILFVMLKDDKGGYKTYKLFENDKALTLKCLWGKEIVGRRDGDANSKIEKFENPNGVFIQLIRPESFSIAFYWENGEFHQVWTSI